MSSRSAVFSSTSATGMHIDAFDGELHQEPKAEHRAFQKRIENSVAAMEAVKQSTEYTHAGKIARLTDLRIKGLQEIEPLRQRLHKIEKMVADLIANALNARKPSDDISESREREIRDRLFAQNAGPLDVLPRLLDAINRGDREFVNAVLNAPSAFPLLDEEGRRQALNATIAHTPALSSQLRDLEWERSFLGGLSEAARQDVEAAASFGVPGPRAQGSTGMPGSPELIAE